ncbi:TIM barrel protein, partial [Vibrio anguillarum]
ADVKNRKLSFLDSVLEGVYTVPGDGCIDYPAVFNVLKTVNYTGWLVVEAEQDPAIAHPLTYATLGYNNLSKFAKEARLL